MTQYNPFTEWSRSLRPNEIDDVRRWYGSTGTPCQDALIGMALNGMFWDGVFSKVSTRLPKLRQGFRPQVSALAAALGTDFPSLAGVDVGRIDKTVSLSLGKSESMPALRTASWDGPDVSIATATGDSQIHWKPGKALTGQENSVTVNCWDELERLDNIRESFSRAVNPDVDRWVRSVIGEPYTYPADGHRTLLPDRLSHRQPDYLKSIVHSSMPVTVAVPPPAKSSDDLMQEMQEFIRAVEEAKAADRARQLTTQQVVQLCFHFELYTLDAIVEFIKEHQR